MIDHPTANICKSGTGKALEIVFNVSGSNLVDFKSVVCTFNQYGIVLREALLLDDNVSNVRNRKGSHVKYGYKCISIGSARNMEEFIGHYVIEKQDDSFLLIKS